MSSAGAVSAGIASLVRKAATPARTRRMRMPDLLAPPAKMRSPGRRTARGCCAGWVGAFVAVTAAPWESFVGASTRGPGGATARDVVRRPGPAQACVSADRGDGVDGALRLLPEAVRDGRVAGVV